MDKRKNKAAFVSGSSRGIGRAIAIKLALQGYDVILNCKKDVENLKQVEEKIKKFGVRCKSFVADVGDYTACASMFQAIFEEFGYVDVLVNNAGISMTGLLQDMTPQEWQDIMQTNLSSVFYCSKLVIPKMIEMKSGCIINISSVWGMVGASCEVAYSATKGGMNAFTKALAKELAPSHITVNAIAAGAIDTAMLGIYSQEEKQDIIESIPSMRLGRAGEVADLVLHLLSHPYLNGQVIAMDGAWT